jgi:hypothetical protein
VGRRSGRDAAVEPLIANPAYAEVSPMLSPNGQWLAYTSDETGQFEVYVRPFPHADSTKFSISTSGGVSPLWAHSGRELFYLNGDRDQMMAVRVSPGPAFRHDEPRTLFRLHDGLLRGAFNFTWFDISRDDQHFLMARRAGPPEQGAVTIVVMLNWLSELEAKMKAK